MPAFGVPLAGLGKTVGRGGYWGERRILFDSLEGGGEVGVFGAVGAGIRGRCFFRGWFGAGFVKVVNNLLTKKEIFVFVTALMSGDDCYAHLDDMSIECGGLRRNIVGKIVDSRQMEGYI